MSVEEEQERKHLQDLQSNHQRWFSQEEFDRLKELNRILLEEETNNNPNDNKTRDQRSNNQIPS